MQHRGRHFQPVDPDPERARMEIAELLVQATPRERDREVHRLR